MTGGERRKRIEELELYISDAEGELALLLAEEEEEGGESETEAGDSDDP